MLEKLQNFIVDNHLFNREDKILLAVSGGVDSIVMLYLFMQLNYDFGVVHCNFQLRGESSDEEQQFIKHLVTINNIPFYTKNFETKEYADINGVSIEMAARELRYSYFQELIDEYEYQYVATAHHQDDVVETFFLNLSRKTGIKGLTGISVKRENIIRPMLFTNRDEILKYADDHQIGFREDKSNKDTKFKRNFIRHKIIPLLTELNPSFKNNLLASIKNLKEVEELYTKTLSKERENVVTTIDSGIQIDIEKLKQSTFSKLLLFEILSDFNFNATIISEVFSGLSNISGKQFYSSTHRIIKDRAYLYVVTNNQRDSKIFYIEEDDIELFEPLHINIDYFTREKFSIPIDKNIGCFDADKLTFPLLIRNWKQGDYFQPLGMDGLKKVSDFFIDQKLPLHEKEQTWLLCNGNDIVWIIGHRIDDRYKISHTTNKILKVEYISQ